MSFEFGRGYDEYSDAVDGITRAFLEAELAVKTEEFSRAIDRLQVKGDPILLAVLGKLVQGGSDMEPNVSSHLRKMATLRFSICSEGISGHEGDNEFYEAVVENLSSDLEELAGCDGQELPELWAQAASDLVSLELQTGTLASMGAETEKFEVDDQGKYPVAGAVIRDEDGRYLMVQETKPHVYGMWNLPAGRQDEHERSLQETVIREVHEEVGLHIELLSDEPLLESQDSKENGRSLTSYRARVVGGTLAPQADELLAVRWLTLQEIQALNDQGKLRDPWTLNSILKAEHYENSRD